MAVRHWTKYVYVSIWLKQKALSVFTGKTLPVSPETKSDGTNVPLHLSRYNCHDLLERYRDVLTFFSGYYIILLMKRQNETLKALSFSIPLSLAEKLQNSAKESRRSFTQEIVWRLERSFVADNESKVVVER